MAARPGRWPASARCGPGGLLVATTPYHNYVKDLLLAVAGRWDRSHGALYTSGHIKFFSRATPTQLLEVAGFTVAGFRGAGRFCPLWKCMVMSARRLVSDRDAS